ncbi:hypothetical protein MPL3365_290003 [Mesorhizobium plurifarium]|uniref:Uncharacterized protein n=1 Tax=Mesorhizobium plurifarium TaxID=69974 RepID=A0A090GD91_MESPL|nr:hypothetical protein MPL3365_290003 [Mesorhizobium plurifarium]
MPRPRESEPCAWNTFFAICSPIVVTPGTGASLRTLHSGAAMPSGASSTPSFRRIWSELTANGSTSHARTLGQHVYIDLLWDKTEAPTARKLALLLVLRFARPYERIRRKWVGEPPAKVLIFC